MTLASRIVLIAVAVFMCAFIGALVFRKLAPKYEFVLPLMFSVAALVTSLISSFKNELFDFDLRVVTGV